MLGFTDFVRITACFEQIAASSKKYMNILLKASI